MAESLPGFAPHVHEGGNYAQPTATTGALPIGNPLEQVLVWSGCQNCGAPQSGNPQLAEAYGRFERDAANRLSPDEQRVHRAFRYQFYEALLDE